MRTRSWLRGPCRCVLVLQSLLLSLAVRSQLCGPSCLQTDDSPSATPALTMCSPGDPWSWSFPLPLLKSRVSSENDNIMGPSWRVPLAHRDPCSWEWSPGPKGRLPCPLGVPVRSQNRLPAHTGPIVLSAWKEKLERRP